MKKILVAEEDTFLANTYRVKLTKAGFEVHIVGDGQEAINSLATSVPDLIILDLLMPVKDGYKTLQEVKQNPAWAKIPVIIASNLGQKEDLDKTMQLGASDFVVKSDSLDILIQKVTTILGQTPAPH
jgi:two-component system, OmpR family, alkaline phosphatase synthesis response regulator PhoP